MGRDLLWNCKILSFGIIAISPAQIFELNCKHGLGSAPDFVGDNGICLRRRLSME
jgi:hypothetical protein